MVDTAKALFESYNRVIEGSYNKAFENNDSDDFMKIKEAHVQQYLKKDIEQWNESPLNELNGLSPRDYIESMDDFNFVFEIFELGARLCDQDVPEVLTDKLKSFGPMSVERLLKLASDPVNSQEENEVYVKLLSIRTLGEWKCKEAIAPLLELLKQCEETNELLMEEVFSAFVSTGESVIDPVIEELTKGESIKQYHEYLIVALADIGREHRSDRIYRCLKDIFLKMENKIIGASALATYGDGRAIPALRGYIERNKDSMDAEVFYEVKIAVEQLGGTLDDITISSFRRRG